MRTLVKTSCGTPSNNRFFFDDVFGKDLFDFAPTFNGKNVPAVNVKETETDFNIEVAVPGFQKEDFSITLHENILSIAVEQKTEKNENDDKARFSRREFSYAAFKRSFTLNEDSIDTEKIAAKYENGILLLQIPKKGKTEIEKKEKTISVA